MLICIVGVPITGKVVLCVDPTQTFHTIFPAIADAVCQESNALWSTHDLHPAAVTCAQSHVLRPRRYVIRPNDTVASLNLQSIHPDGPRLLVLRQRQPVARDSRNNGLRHGKKVNSFNDNSANKENELVGRGETIRSNLAYPDSSGVSIVTLSSSPLHVCEPVRHLTMRKREQANVHPSHDAPLVSLRARKITCHTCLTRDSLEEHHCISEDVPSEPLHVSTENNNLNDADVAELFSIRNSPVSDAHSLVACKESCARSSSMNAARMTVHASSLRTSFDVTTSKTDEGLYRCTTSDEAGTNKLSPPNASSWQVARSLFALRSTPARRSEHMVKRCCVCVTDCQHTRAHRRSMLLRAASFVERTRAVHLARAYLHSWRLYHAQQKLGAATQTGSRDVVLDSTQACAPECRRSSGAASVPIHHSVNMGASMLCINSADLLEALRGLYAELRRSSGSNASGSALSQIEATDAPSHASHSDATMIGKIVPILHLCTCELRRRRDCMSRYGAAVATSELEPAAPANIATLLSCHARTADEKDSSHANDVDCTSSGMQDGNAYDGVTARSQRRSSYPTCDEQAEHGKLAEAPLHNIHDGKMSACLSDARKAVNRMTLDDTPSTPFHISSSAQSLHTFRCSIPTQRQAASSATTRAHAVVVCGHHTTSARSDTMTQNPSPRGQHTRTSQRNPCVREQATTACRTHSASQSSRPRHVLHNRIIRPDGTRGPLRLSRNTTPQKATRPGMLSEPFACSARPGQSTALCAERKSARMSRRGDCAGLPARDGPATRCAVVNRCAGVPAVTDSVLRVPGEKPTQHRGQRGANTRETGTTGARLPIERHSSSSSTVVASFWQNRGLCLVCGEQLTTCREGGGTGGLNEQAALCLACYRVYTFAELAARDRILGL